MNQIPDNVNVSTDDELQGWLDAQQAEAARLERERRVRSSMKTWAEMKADFKAHLAAKAQV